MLFITLLLVTLGSRSLSGVAAAQERLSLAGQWRFQADPEAKGVADEWFRKPLPGSIWLPGSMRDNGLGDEVTVETEWTGGIKDRSWFEDPAYEAYRQPGNIKVPFWLTPTKHYIGPAWYQRDFVVPRAWEGKRISLLLERCHWETHVWIGGRDVGTQDSLSTPHEYELGVLSPGPHRLTIRVDNTVKLGVGPDAHSVSDHTQSNWNGIIGAIELQARGGVWIEDVQVYPDVAKKRAKVRVTVGGDRKAEGTVTLAAATTNAEKRHTPAPGRKAIEIKDGRTVIEMDYELGADALLWDEFSPNLYRLDVSVSGDGFAARKSVTFGMREIATAGTQFTLNGRKTFLRGTLECCIFPLTGHPPMDVPSWRKVLRAAKAHGLNHLRFHSWCPPEAAFVAADEMGVTFHVECAAWTNSGPTIGDGKPIDKYIYAEGDRILKTYGNHPSFCFLAYGNEPAGRNQKQFLGKLVKYWQAKDDRRLYTSAAGWPIIPESDFHSTPAPRVHQWGQGLKSRFNARELTTNIDYSAFVKRHSAPVVAHEIGQWGVYPSFDEMAKYTGGLKPKNFEIFRDSLARHHMLDQARDFLLASGKLQALLYKEEIEAALRTPGFGGFQLLDLHDFPGQGTALVGVLDPFWESKGYIEPDEFRRFCCETVPLLRMDKCIWTTDETFTGRAEIAHFGPAPFRDAKITWRAETADGSAIATGRFPVQTVPVGRVAPLGPIEFDLADVVVPARLVIRVAVEGTAYKNHWDVWVYPAQTDVPTPPEVKIADSLDENTIATLEQGGAVLLMPPLESIRSDVPSGFSTIFWNTQWTNRQPPHTLGILCDPDHPALAAFPTEFHSNWQWWDLVGKSKFLMLDELGPELRPIVQVIDDWNTNRKLGLVFETKVGPGKLLFCSIDLRTDLARRPVARQMLRSLLHYAASETFDPKTSCSVDRVNTLFE
jgi:hypothetical protein